MESEEATRSQVAVLNAQIESLTVKVEGKDRELVDLERQLQELKDRNTALENQLSEYMAAMQEQSKVHVVLSFNFMYCTCTCIISYRDKANASNNTRRQSFFFPKRKRRAASGGTRTHDVLRSRQMLYQLSHRGSLAGRAESLKFIQGKWCLTCTYTVHVHEYTLY